MNSDKLIEAVVKGSSVLNSFRKINKSLNSFRIISYVFLIAVLIINLSNLSVILKGST